MIWWQRFRQWWSIDAADLLREVLPSELGLEALEVAKEQAGLGEVGRNNAGEHVDRYRRGERLGRGGAWCAYFVLWCVEVAAERLGRPMPFTATYRDWKGRRRRIGGARRLWKTAANTGRIVTIPQPGDLVLWKRGDGWQGHIGLFSRRSEDGAAFEAWEGNVGAFPATPGPYWHRFDDPRLLGFVRLP